MDEENQTNYTTEIKIIVLELKKTYGLIKHREAREIIRREILHLDELRTAIIKNDAAAEDTDSQSMQYFIL